MECCDCHNEGSPEHAAWAIGHDHGVSAGTWVFDGNTSRETYETFRRWDDDGDPQFEDHYPGATGEIEDPGYDDAQAAAYEEGHRDGWTAEVRRVISVQLDQQRWTPESAGCIFAGASTRTADELNACVVLLALGEGWTWTGETQADRLELRQLAENTDGWLEDHDESDALTEAAQDATTWLNEHIAPEGYHFTFDEGFYLYGKDS